MRQLEKYNLYKVKNFLPAAHLRLYIKGLKMMFLLNDLFLIFCMFRRVLKPNRKFTSKLLILIVFSPKCFFSREKADLNELITPEWLELIQIHSGLNNSDFDFNPKNLLLAIEVGKSLCNVAFNSTAAADNCCKNGILDQLSRRLNKNVPYEMKFFDVKLVFILTALCPWARKTVKSEMGGVTSLIQVMDSILKEAAIQSIPDPICLDVSYSEPIFICILF